MSDTIITVENLSKRYKLGTIGATTLRDSVERAWHRLRGRDWRHHMGTVGSHSPQRAQGAQRENEEPSTKHKEHNADTTELWALKDVSFEVKRGEVLGVIGRNGAGKSTLLKILTRITEPTSGRAIMRGRVASLLEVGTGFHPELTGRENVYLNGAILGMKRAEITQKFDEIVAFAETEKFIDTPVKRYSSGMYVRLAFAVAAHLDPEILLVDEVLAVGDASFQKKCLGKMKDVASLGRTVLFVSHNMSAIVKLCSNSILLEAGRIVASGSSMDLISQYIYGQTDDVCYNVLPHQHNQGTREVDVLTSAIGSSDGSYKNQFMIGEQIVLSAGFECKKDFPEGIAFWLIICAYDGSPFLCAHQNDVNYVPCQKGFHRVNLYINGPSLLPGDYNVMLGTFDSKHEFMDWVDGFQRFKIVPMRISGSPFDGRWGIAEANVEWKIFNQ